MMRIVALEKNNTMKKKIKKTNKQKMAWEHIWIKKNWTPPFKEFKVEKMVVDSRLRNREEAWEK